MQHMQILQNANLRKKISWKWKGSVLISVEIPLNFYFQIIGGKVDNFVRNPSIISRKCQIKIPSDNTNQWTKQPHL